MKELQPTCITPDYARWLRLLAERLGEQSAPKLWVLGNLSLLKERKTALFCSARCPGSAILAAYDQTARWRDARRCIISGFHSPVEKECLRILLRGSPPRTAVQEVEWLGPCLVCTDQRTIPGHR